MAFDALAAAPFLADQIRLIQRAIGQPFDPDPTFNDDVTGVVATSLAQQGVADVRHLRYYENAAADLAFFYDGSTGALLVNPMTGDRVTYDANVASDPQVHRLIGYYHGRFDDYWVYCYVNNGYPTFVARRVKQANQWQVAFHQATMLASIAIGAGFAGLATELGTAVLGADTAAAFPALADGIGNVCINTALNGGNVQSAVVGAVSGGVGGAVGGAVVSATDSTIAGAAAAAATRAAISGGNIESAALQSLVRSGVQSGANILTTSSSSMIGDSTSDPTYSTAVDGGDPTGMTQTIDYSGGVYDPSAVIPPDYAGTPADYHDPTWSVDGSSEGATLPMPGVTSAPPGPSGVIATGADGSSLTSLAMTGLKLLQSWSGAGQPAIRTANASTRPNANGTLTNLQTGAVVQMPKGSPYLLPNGSLVTNNGDGTYTTITSSGGVSTTAYQGTSIHGGIAGLSPMLLLGGAAVALLLLSKR